MSRQGRESAAGAGRTEVEAGDNGLSGSAQTNTKNHERPNADAGVRRVCGIYGAKRNKSHCLAAGARSGQLWPPSEELEDLEQSGKAFNSGEEKAAIIDNIGKADTLPTEGFYD